MQAISREVLLSKGLPPELELRKGAEIPPWFAQVCDSSTSQRAWWQVYLDNVISAEVGQGQLTGFDKQLQTHALNASGSAAYSLQKISRSVQLSRLLSWGFALTEMLCCWAARPSGS